MVHLIWFWPWMPGLGPWMTVRLTKSIRKGRVRLLFFFETQQALSLPLPAIVQNFQVADKPGLKAHRNWNRLEFLTWSKLGIHTPFTCVTDSDNLRKSFKTGIKEVGRLRIGKILRKNRWMSDEEKMIYLQFYNEIEFWSFNTVSNEIKWYYIIIDILEVLSFAENVRRKNMEYRLQTFWANGVPY